MPPKDEQKPKNSQLTEVVDSLQDVTNVLVTVSNNPSVDQLAACIGLTLALNKNDKHATAVFSGAVPSTLEFLEPEKTLEKTTDSLRDFIISLDKSKADKLRYKVEEDVVKIFITPYRTSINQDDLQFGQGDFNVDAVVALGVHDRADLDAAIVAHGRILHDATIISVNTADGGEIGAVNWLDTKSSSLSEMMTDLVTAIDDKLFDSQIATALLTGIVAETDRFRNERVTPHTMTLAGTLMSAGASTQLVSSKLEEPEPEPEPPQEEEPEPEHEEAEQLPQAVSLPEPEEPKEDDGTIHIDHDDDIHIDDTGKLAKVSDILREIDEQENGNKDQGEQPAQEQPSESPPSQPEPAKGPSMIFEPPTFGGQLTANTDKVDQRYDHNPDPLTVPAMPQGPTLNRPNEPDFAGGGQNQTLSDLERSLNSPHIAQYEETPVPPLPTSGPDVPEANSDVARDAIERAVQASSEYRPEPIAGLGAQPFGDGIDHNQQPPDQTGPPPPPVPPPLPQ